VSVASRAALSNLGPALSRRGAHAEALGVLRAAIDDATANGDPFTAGVTSVYLAEALQRAGDLPAAEIAARAALPALAAFHAYECMAMAQLADVLLAARRHAEALPHARAAFARLSSLGQIDEGEALVWVVYAAALYASGDREGARVAIGAARGRLLERAAQIRDEDARGTFLSAVPEHARTLALAARWSL
jgi:hypothetical protein